MGKEDSVTDEIVGTCKLCKNPVFHDEAWVLDGWRIEHSNCRDAVEREDG